VVVVVVDVLEVFQQELAVPALSSSKYPITMSLNSPVVLLLL
jgi:hypothetical protein